MLKGRMLAAIMLVLALSFSGCEKEEGKGYNITAILHSIETEVDDPLFGCELYGSILSLPDDMNQSSAHDHFQHTEDSPFLMGLNETHVFSETDVTAKTWKNLSEDDAIIIRIILKEDDVDLGDSDDEFGVKNFTYPVDELLAAISMSSSAFAEKSGLTVYSGTESITITFHFRKE